VSFSFDSVHDVLRSRKLTDDEAKRDRPGPRAFSGRDVDAQGAFVPFKIRPCIAA